MLIVVCINSNCLQFGVYNTTGIFQYEMVEWLKDFPFCKMQVSEFDSISHFMNIQNVKAKKTKCQLFFPGVTYLWFRMSKEGRTPLPEKVAAMQKVRTTKNITKFKSFLGALKYCNHHLPKWSTVVDLLNHVLNLGLRMYQKKIFSSVKSINYELQWISAHIIIVSYNLSSNLN